ncbi:hypothetical protein [Streptomyces sp. NPDC051183]
MKYVPAGAENGVTNASALPVAPVISNDEMSAVVPSGEPPLEYTPR